MIEEKYIDQTEQNYRNKRISHWNRVSPNKENNRRADAYYHELLMHYCKFLIPQGSRILELGCGHGDLIASTNPSMGVGVDFAGDMISYASVKHPNLYFVRADGHEIVFKEKFDFIILSDLVNDLWDVQALLENLKRICHSRTRLVINFYNNLWRIPLSIVKLLGLGADFMEQNWFSPNDVFNMLELTDFEVVKYSSHILSPLPVPILSKLANKYLVNIIPFNWLALTNFVIARPVEIEKQNRKKKKASVSIIIPARNEAGNIKNIVRRVPSFGKDTELVFVEGNSTDNTYIVIQNVIKQFSEKNCKLLRQKGEGKGDAVRLGFEKAKGDILMILDADMTVPPEDLNRFYEALVSGKGEFINGVRLVYPLQDQSMRFLNIVGNKFFSLAFSWLLGQPVKDTLCGTKVLWRQDYRSIESNRDYFGNFDPFGDFDLLFGASKLNLKIVEMPIRYRSRTYGETNIDRWRHGWLLLKMVVFAAKRLKFI
ncbi:MAG: glycosyltransferase [Thermodesulfobacteriota bacterium]|nr:glycosyltransferase [Thermodesulfobacteriota bacterium]